MHSVRPRYRRQGTLTLTAGRPFSPVVLMIPLIAKATYHTRVDHDKGPSVRIQRWNNTQELCSLAGVSDSPRLYVIAYRDESFD